MTRESEQTTRVREARAALLATHPFFGVLALKLALAETTAIATAQVTTADLRFNPAYVDDLGNAELKGLVSHGVLHLAMGHHARQGTRDAAMWNEACDYAINSILIADGFTLPKGALVAAEFNGQPAESIYETLRGRKQDQQPEQPKGGKDKPDASGQDGAGAGDDGQGEPAQGQGTPKPGPGAGDGATGSFAPAGAEGSAEACESEREWRENAAEAMRAAASAGKMPAGIRREIEKALAPKADWKSLLRRFMTDQVRTRSTWSTRNKRFPDIYLPGRTKDGMGELIVAVDTSGSIDARTLGAFAAEIASICEDVEPACVLVIYCDAEVNRVDTYEHGETIALEACGGGGTAFAPVFERVDAEGWNPAALIYLTDLMGSFPSHEPAYPTLWASYAARGAQAPFGETVAID